MGLLDFLGSVTDGASNGVSGLLAMLQQQQPQSPQGNGLLAGAGNPYGALNLPPLAGAGNPYGALNLPPQAAPQGQQDAMAASSPDMTPTQSTPQPQAAPPPPLPMPPPRPPEFGPSNVTPGYGQGAPQGGMGAGAPPSPPMGMQGPPPATPDAAQPGFMDRLGKFAGSLGNVYGAGGPGDGLINLGLALASPGNRAENLMRAGQMNTQMQTANQARQLQQMQLAQQQTALKGNMAIVQKAFPQWTPEMVAAGAGQPAVVQDAIKRTNPAEQWTPGTNSLGAPVLQNRQTGDEKAMTAPPETWVHTKNADGDDILKNTRTGQETLAPTAKETQKLVDVQMPDGSKQKMWIKAGEATGTNVGAPVDAETAQGAAGTKIMKPGDIMVGHGGKLLYQAPKPDSSMADQTADFLAERVLSGDTRALIGLGRGAQGSEDLKRIQGLVAKKAAERGIDAGDILAKAAEQSGLTAQQRTFGTQTARMAVASTEANGAIDLARQASGAVPRGDYVPVNKAIQAFQSNSSNVPLAKLGAALMTTVNTYARAINPNGVPHVQDKEEATKLLSQATSHESLMGVLDQLQQEIELAHNSPLVAKQMLENQRKGRPSMYGITRPTTESNGGTGATPAPEKDHSHLWLGGG